MDVLALRAVVLGANLSAHGVDATVTRPWPDDTPIQTTVIWCTPGLILESAPGDFDVRRKDRRRVIALTVADVPTVPRKTRIVAAEVEGGPALAWRADSIEYEDAQHRRVVVVPEPEP